MTMMMQSLKPPKPRDRQPPRPPKTPRLQQLRYPDARSDEESRNTQAENAKMKNGCG